MSGDVAHKSPRRARLGIRAIVTDDRDALDFDRHARAGEIRNSDKGRARIIAVLERLQTKLDEAVAVAWIIDEHRHGDEVGEAASGLLEGLVHRAEDGPG